MSFDSYHTIGDFEISNICLQSYPCQHYIKNTKTDVKLLMNGIDILHMLNNAGLYHTHFDKYKKCI